MLIAQISDTHIGRPGDEVMGGVDTAGNLAKVVAHIADFRPLPDIVLVTGDLVNRGDDEEYTVLRQLLAPLTMPCFVIPGNHDDRDGMRRNFADHAYLPSRGVYLHYVIDDYPLRLVGLDTVIPGEPGGEMCEARLRWLDDILSRAPDRPTLVFMHHPPFTIGIDIMDDMRCSGGDAMGRIIERHSQVERILCGHVHRPVTLRWHGTTASTAPSTGAQLSLTFDDSVALSWSEEPPAYALHLWRPGKSLVSHVSQVGAFDRPRSIGSL